jgi:hypothetical protein
MHASKQASSCQAQYETLDIVSQNPRVAEAYVRNERCKSERAVFTESCHQAALSWSTADVHVALVSWC